jgi:hypothetical protein
MEGRLLDSMVSVRPESRTGGMAGPAGGSVQPAAGGAAAASPTAAVAADADLAPSTPHLGLGLYIARLVAEFHRGRIDVRNRDDGRGVVVRVALPTA